MTDEVVRQLARHAGNSPADCLRHSRALELLGRHDEALAALLPAVDSLSDSPDVRSAIARSPGGTAHSGWGAISYVCPASVAAKPTVQWRTPLGRSAHWSLLASELGIVAISDSEMISVDPATGSRRWREPTGPQARRTSPWLAEDVAPSVDDHGVFARVEPEGLATPAPARSRDAAPRGERVLYSRGGEVRWRRHDSLHPRGLTPEFGVALKIGSYRSQWAAIERASGKRVALLANPTALAGARGTLYFASGASEGEAIYRSRDESRPWSRLAAIGTTGAERWRITPEENPGYFDAIAPLGGRLYAVESDADEAFVVCLA